MENYEIQLGIGLNESDFNDIKTKLKTLEDDGIDIKLNTKEVDNQINSIKKQLQDLSSGNNKNLLTFDTSKLESSLLEVKNVIVDIKKSLSSLDGKGMKDIAVSINQMATALGKAENESESLVKSLSALSKKEFGFTFNVDAGKKNNNMIAYGREARKKIIPELERQAQELEKMLGGQKEATRKLMSKSKDIGFDVFEDFNDFNSESAIKKMEAMEKYVNSMKKLASMEGINLDGFNQIHKEASALIDDVTGVESAVNKAGDIQDKLKNIFGGSVDGENLSRRLESVVVDLGEIKTTIQGLSSGVSLDGLIQSFNRLSETLDRVASNFNNIKDVLNSSLIDNKVVQTAQQTGQKIGESIKQSAEKSLTLDDVIDQQVTELMNKYAIAGKKGSKAFDEIRQAIVEYRRELALADSAEPEFDDEFLIFSNSADIKKATSALASHVKYANEAKETYRDLLDYVRDFNTKGAKVHLPESIRQEYGDDFRSMRSSLGAAFTTGQGQDFESFIMELNGQLGNVIDLSNGAEAAFGDLVNKVNSAKGSKFLSDDELFDNGILNFEEVKNDITTAVNNINSAEQKMANISDSVTSEIIQNEERKQQAYEDTLAKQRQRVDEIDKSIDDYTNRLTDPNVSIDDGQKYMNNIDTLEQERVEILANIEQIETAFKSNENILNSFKNSLKNIGMGSEEIDAVANRISNLSVQIETLNQKKSTRRINTEDGVFEKEVLDVDISGLDEYGNAIKLTEQYDIATGDLVKSLERVSTVQQKAGASTDTFVKQQKTAVSNLTNQINQMNRAALDQNASKPIKDVSHLDTLKSKYNEVISAIERMENASSDTFVDEQNNVKRLISEYKSLVSEYKNAENVSTKMKGTDFQSGLDIARNDLEKFKAQAKDFPQIINTIESLDKAIEGVGDAASLNKFNDQLRVARSELAKIKSETIASNRSEKVGINVSGLESKIADLQRISPEVNRFEAEVDGAKVTVQSLLNDLSRVNTQSDLSVVTAKFRAFTDSAKSAGIAVTEVAQKTKSIDSIRMNFNTDTYYNQFSQMQSNYERLITTNEELKASYIEVENAYKELNHVYDTSGTSDEVADKERLIQAEERYAEVLKKTNNLIKVQARSDKTIIDRDKLDDDIKLFQADIDKWLVNNSAATKQFGARMLDLKAKAEGVDRVTLNGLIRQFKLADKQAEKLGLNTQSTFDRLKTKFKEYTSYLSAAEIFMYAEQTFRSMFEQVILIDSAMTELKKVTDETNASYDRFLTNAASKAREIGTTIDGLVESTAGFARLGYDFTDAQGLAEVANIYAVVGDEVEGVEGATESLISTMAAFKDEMNGMSNTDFAMSIIDKFNEIGNNFAITSGGIGEALKRSASSLMAANNTIDESIALITAAM